MRPSAGEERHETWLGVSPIFDLKEKKPWLGVVTISMPGCKEGGGRAGIYRWQNAKDIAARMTMLYLYSSGWSQSACRAAGCPEGMVQGSCKGGKKGCSGGRGQSYESSPRLTSAELDTDRNRDMSMGSTTTKAVRDVRQEQ